MNNKYECVLVFDPNLSDQAVDERIGKVEALIKSHSGSISEKDAWGKRQLAYPIEGKESGNYVCLQFEGDNSAVVDIERSLRIDESVLRYLTVLKDKYAPDRAVKGKDDGREREHRGDSRGEFREGRNDRRDDA